MAKDLFLVVDLGLVLDLVGPGCTGRDAERHATAAQVAQLVGVQALAGLVFEPEALADAIVPVHLSSDPAGVAHHAAVSHSRLSGCRLPLARCARIASIATSTTPPIGKASCRERVCQYV